MPPRKPRPKPSRARTERRLPALQFSHPLPYGAVLHEGGVQFVVYSRSATGMRVLLYDAPDAADPAEFGVLDLARKAAGQQHRGDAGANR